MSVSITVPKKNIREELASLKTTPGVTGKRIYEADTVEEARRLIGAGRKNYIINGGFDVWQRGTSGFGHNEYSADRWAEFTTTNDILAISRQSFNTGQTEVPGNPNYYLSASLTAGTGGGVNGFRHRVENVNLLSGEEVTISYWVRSSVPVLWDGQILSQVFGSGGSASVFKTLPDVQVSNHWTKVENTIKLESTFGKTLGTKHFVELVLSFPTNLTTVFDIAQVQLERGVLATEFEHRNIGEELALCQRYYEKGVILIESSASTTLAVSNSYKVEKRVTPTLTVGAVAGTGHIVLNTNGDPTGSIELRGSANAVGRLEATYTASAEL